MVNKPVIAPSVKRNAKMDKNHISILEPLELLYSNKEELVNKTLFILENQTGNKVDYKLEVKKYEPQIVARQFKDFFLTD